MSKGEGGIGRYWREERDRRDRDMEIWREEQGRRDRDMEKKGRERDTVNLFLTTEEILYHVSGTKGSRQFSRAYFSKDLRMLTIVQKSCWLFF